ncbi:ABC transporter [Thozetella sp. PMI_491]|nr:ABC transporter [Thozetella sp. PMI_491]
MLRCSGDDTIGPALDSSLFSSGCYNFDFTLVFEDVISSLLPCGILLILCPWRLRVLSRRSATVRWPLLRALKWLGFGTLAISQLSLLLVQGLYDGTVVQTTIAAGILSLLSILGLVALSDYEHCRSISPSIIIQIFLLLSTVLSLPTLRTIWLLGSASTTAALYTLTFSLRIVLLALESAPKWKHTVEPPELIPPEETQGIFGHTFFWWLIPMFMKGYTRDLTMKDLVIIDDNIKGDQLYERFIVSWNSVNQTTKHCLTRAVFKTFFPDFSLATIPCLFYAAFGLAQPYLINSMITYVTFHKSLPENYGYGLIGAYALCYIGIALSARFWMQIAFRTMAKIRGALVTAIYRKMLAIRAESRNSSAAMSLMSTDVDRITMTTFMCVKLIPDIVQLIVALIILGMKLGATTVAPIILCIICIGIAARIGKLVPPRQRRWMMAIQKRVGITADIIGAMKGVKVAGLGVNVDKQIDGLRDYEIDRSVQFRKMQIVTQILGTSPTLLLPAVTFTAYAIAQKVSGSSDFDIAKAFTALSLLNILIVPLMDMTQAWTSLSSALACLDRIQSFLLKEDRVDYRILASNSRSSSFSKTETKANSFDEQRADEAVIKIRKGCFGWNKELDVATLEDIDLDIMPGKLMMVVGPVGSGKTTLLESIIAEARIISGSVEVTIPEEIAYCGQDAWLLNQSVKENILAFQAYSEDFYQDVVEACQLNEDFRQFPKGDDSIIGSRGISLSGGQKQRVALARAVYNRTPIVLLDDVLKGLDADTASKCYAALLLPGGLLRRSRIAVVLATHNVQLLPHADHIVVLGRDGRIAQQGSFDDLNSCAGYVRSLALIKSTTKETEVTIAEDWREEQSEKRAVIEKVSPAERATDVDAKRKSRGKRNSDALFSYVRSMGKVYFPIFCVFTIFNIGFRSAQPLWLKIWTSANQEDPGSKIGYYTGVYILLGCLSVVFLALQFWTFMILIVPHSARVLHRRVLTAVMHAPLAFFVITDTGEIVNRFSQDMTLVDMPLPQSFLQSYSQVVNALAQIALTCVGSGWLGLSLPVVFFVLFCLQKFYLRTSRQMRLLDLEAKSPLYSHFISSFSGLSTLRAYGWTAMAKGDNLRYLDESQRPFYLLRCVQRWLTMALNLIVAGLAVLLVGLTIALKDSIDPGYLGVALTSVMNIGQTLSQLMQSWTQVETSLGAITRIDQFSAETPREPDGPDMPPAKWPAKGAINISGLYANYGNHTVLTNINLNILPGEKVAVCGRSGSGKSTLISLLLRLYEPREGQIVIDGIDTSTLNLNALRQSLVALPQDPMFLAGTVRYNLDPLSRHSDEGITMALQKMGIKEVIDEKGGLDTELNTDWLSAGQRQLFCLTRAMLRDSKVILLDEATSSLDRDTEAHVDDLIRKEFGDWTAIVVAHRLKTIADFDKVLVLQDGHAIEYDTPRNLLARDSKFRMMWKLQEE